MAVSGRRHHRTKEHGAFGTPHGRPRQPLHDAPDAGAHGSGAGPTRSSRVRPDCQAGSAYTKMLLA
jgi:hypothetical protein